MYYKMIHGPYNIKLTQSFLPNVSFVVISVRKTAFCFVRSFYTDSVNVFTVLLALVDCIASCSWGVPGIGETARGRPCQKDKIRRGHNGCIVGLG